MAFVDSSRQQKCELVDYSTKTANLGRRLTHGSGVVTDELADTMDTHCAFLTGVLGAMGYESVPLPGTATVKQGEAAPVVNSAGTAVPGTHTIEVQSNDLKGIKLAATIWPVQNGANNVRVTNSAGASITGAAGATVANGVGSVKLPSNWAAVNNGASLTLGNSTYTFQISNGVITGITVS